MVMDGVYPPQLKDLRSGKENQTVKNPETGRTIRMTKNQPSTVGIPRDQEEDKNWKSSPN
jgi:hypothetical protein